MAANIGGVVLIIIGIVFALNALNSLGGRYGPGRRWRNAALATLVALGTIGGGVALIAG